MKNFSCYYNIRPIRNCANLNFFNKVFACVTSLHNSSIFSTFKKIYQIGDDNVLGFKNLIPT